MLTYQYILNSLLIPIYQHIIVTTLLCLYSGTILLSQDHLLVLPSPVTYIDTLSDGQLLVGTQLGQLYTYDGIRKQQVGSKNMGTIRYMHAYQSGKLIATSEGLYMYVDGRIIETGQIKIDAYKWYQYQGRLYVVASTGLYELVGNQLKELFDRSQKSPAYRDFIAFDNDIYILGDTYLRHLSKEQDTLYFQEQRINDVAVFQDELLLADNTGLFVIKGGTKKQLVLDGQVINDPVDKILPVDNQLIISGQNLSKIWDPEVYSLDQLPSPLERDNAIIQSAVLDRWKNLWVNKGKLIYLAKVGDEHARPVIHIESVGQNERRLSLSEMPFRFRPDENHLTIETTAHHLSEAENLKTSYKVNKGDWLPYSKKIDLYDLEPMKYEISLRATVDGKYYSYTKPIQFTLTEDKVPVWIVLLGCLGLGALLLSTIAWWQQNNILEKSNLERKKLLAENEALKQGQKALQLQMNPHFIFNAINSIQGLIHSNQSAKANQALGQFAQLMRTTLENSRREWVGIEEEIAYLTHYLELEKMNHSNAFDYSVDVEKEIYEEDLKTLPMIIQPFVENAVIHGVSQVNGGKISIKFVLTDEFLVATIKDNGPGIQNHQPHKHQSYALTIVKDRLDAYDAAGYTITSNDDGVTVRISIPIR